MATKVTDIEITDLYEILDLNENAVRELTKEEQDTVIEKAFERLETSNGNDKLMDAAQVAYDLLKFRNKRVDLNNLLDFNHGFLRRWAAILKPECESEDQAVRCLVRTIVKLLWNIGKGTGVALLKSSSGKIWYKLVIVAIIISVIKEGRDSLEEAKQEFISRVQTTLTDDLPTLQLLSTFLAECPQTRPRDMYKFKYVSCGSWVSRMVVSYNFLGTQMRQIVSGSGKSVTIPADCTNISIRFEILRFPFVWCHLKRRCRSSDTRETHAFEYPEPVGDRTFTIGGSLHFEKILKISDKMGDEVDDI